MLLREKVAVIYGAGGAIGGAVARGFASEGARVFLTGRRRASGEGVAKEIVAAGGTAEAAEGDAREERALDGHPGGGGGRAGRGGIPFQSVRVAGTGVVGG